MGRVTPLDLQQAMAEVERFETSVSPIPPRLTDLSGAQFANVDFGAVFATARTRVMRQFPNSFRSALFAPTPEAFGMARMFQSLNTNPQIFIQVFANREEAVRWLSEPSGDASDGEPH